MVYSSHFAFSRSQYCHTKAHRENIIAILTPKVNLTESRLKFSFTSLLRVSRDGMTKDCFCTGPSSFSFSSSEMMVLIDERIAKSAFSRVSTNWDAAIFTSSRDFSPFSCASIASIRPMTSFSTSGSLSFSKVALPRHMRDDTSSTTVLSLADAKNLSCRRSYKLMLSLEQSCSNLATEGFSPFSTMDAPREMSSQMDTTALWLVLAILFLFMMMFRTTVAIDPAISARILKGSSSHVTGTESMNA